MSDIISSPQHIGIIMDGNRRWAKQNGRDAVWGHKEGYRRLIETVKLLKSKNIRHLTVYAFSTENWKREKFEIDNIMNILRIGLKKDVHTFNNEGIKFKAIGQISDLGEELQKLIIKTETITENNSEGFLNVAISYGGRGELVRAFKKIANSVVKDKEIDENQISQMLDTSGQPDPDLIIRCGGQQRLSNFLLWQSAYSELYFTNKFWPEFMEKDLDEALIWYRDVKRNYGK
ncbi:MAG: polyprenyl diphosphate synthase [bacterium]